MATQVLWKSLLLTVCTLSPVLANSNVERLSSTSFDLWVREHGRALVNFGSRYSRHCEQLAPAYEKAASFLIDYNIHLATVDCYDAFDTICVDHGIRAYPTLRVYHGDPSKYEKYEGGRAVEDIIQYMSNKTCPPEICPTTTTTTTEPPARPTKTPPPNPSPSSTAPNAVWLAENGSEALVKLHLPGLETIDDYSLPSRFSNQALSVLLNFTISANGKHLLLNSQLLALQVPDPSRPSRLQAVHVGADWDLKVHSISRLFDLESTKFRGESLLTDLDYSLSARNRDDPKIRYYNYHPEIYVDIIGAGERELPIRTTLMDSQEQKWLKIQLYDRNNPNSASDDPDRHYAIEKVSFVDRAADYRAPRPDDRKCSLWSWRCADIADPPWYQYVWRQNFDEFGRIGCLRRAVLMWKLRIERVVHVPLWMVVALLFAVFAWQAKVRWTRRERQLPKTESSRMARK